MLAIVEPAVEQLCVAFERYGYNPTPIIDLGVLVASADGKVDARERELLLEVFQALLETALSAEVVDHLITASLEVIEAAGAPARARLVAAILNDCAAVEDGLRVALAIAFASEGLSSSERGVVERIADAGGVSRARLAELIDEVRKHSDGDPLSVRNTLTTGPKSSRSLG